MAKKISVIKMGLVFMAAITYIFASESQAFFYRPAAAVSILSEYAPFSDLTSPRTHVWNVIPESTPDGAATLRFFLEAAAKADAVCELEIPPFGSDGEIRWQGIGGSGGKISNTGLLLVPGFPAPCDVLPVGEQDEGRIYTEKREAGGSVFSKSYKVCSTAFFVADAELKGWIRGETPGVSELILVTVTDEKGRLVLRQLWPAGGSWWLYEETPLRRSWLIY